MCFQFYNKFHPWPELLNISQTIIKLLEACCVKVIFWQMGYRYLNGISPLPRLREQDNSGQVFTNQHGTVHSKRLVRVKELSSGITVVPQILWLKLSHYASKNIKPKEHSLSQSYIKKGSKTDRNPNSLFPHPLILLDQPLTHNLWLLRQILVLHYHFSDLPI